MWYLIRLILVFIIHCRFAEWFVEVDKFNETETEPFLLSTMFISYNLTVN